MPAFLAPLAIGAASGIASYFANQSAAERAAAIQDQAFQQWMAVNIPDPAEQRVALEKFVSQGELDPKMQAAISQNPSEFEKIVTSPTYKSAQNRALSQLEDIGFEGGLRLQDKATIQDAMLDSQTQDRAAREGISANMARRGLSGSGFDVAAQLAGQQQVGDRDAANSMKVAAMANDRALQAIEKGGEIASQYRGQDFGEQAQKASAADRINQFNVQNMRDVGAANTNALNRSAEMNLANKQNISNQNTDVANKQQMYNSNLVQQEYDNRLKKTAGQTGQLNAKAGNELQQGQNTANLIGSIGGAGANAAAQQGYYDYMDDYLKKK